MILMASLRAENGTSLIQSRVMKMTLMKMKLLLHQEVTREAAVVHGGYTDEDSETLVTTMLVRTILVKNRTVMRDLAKIGPI